jgi:hypothetical protein
LVKVTSGRGSSPPRWTVHRRSKDLESIRTTSGFYQRYSNNERGAGAGAKPDPRYDIHYVLSLISSRLIGWYFAEFLSSKRGVMPKTAGQLPTRIVDFGSAAGSDLSPYLDTLHTLLGEPEALRKAIRRVPGPLRTKVLHDYLAASARKMIENNRKVQAERQGFLDWLRVELGVDLGTLSGKSALEEYEGLTAEELLTGNHSAFWSH